MKHSISRTSRQVLTVLVCLMMAMVVGTVFAQAPAPCKNPMIDKCGVGNEIFLMQPLDDETKELEVSSTPLETFFEYFNMSWPWLLGVASGIAVLQAVWGGVLIMTSWDTDGGKEKIQWALGGMVMIALAGFILRFLNPIFFK